VWLQQGLVWAQRTRSRIACLLLAAHAESVRLAGTCWILQAEAHTLHKLPQQTKTTLNPGTTIHAPTASRIEPCPLSQPCRTPPPPPTHPPPPAGGGGEQ
jgi:hypothetical protein